MKRKHYEWRPGGWFLMLTIGGSAWGLGFMKMGRNGIDIYFGPAILTIQPRWWLADETKPSN